MQEFRNAGIKNSELTSPGSELGDLYSCISAFLHSCILNSEFLQIHIICSKINSPKAYYLLFFDR
jgi:hypothetical protein